ncbi:uncharacterized protein AKAME5_002883400 [Lates japonicus]|uniref:Ubiquitin-like domain-containing protein n=1 Tax=Lates japonicus TaxID=270547 RepID=A0AAD3R7H6_LATJO|nr:uncharacterized protein AKAME5_002883400 [Lates japonicus]
MDIVPCDTEVEFKSLTVLQLKRKILRRLPEGTGGFFRLIFAGRQLLKDSTLLCDYGIQPLSVIDIILRMGGGSTGQGQEDGGMGDKEGKNRKRETVHMLLSDDGLCTDWEAVPLTLSDRGERSETARTQKHHEMGKIYQVIVHGLRGKKMIIDLCNTEEQMQSMTVLQLKEKISQRLPDTAGE